MELINNNDGAMVLQKGGFPVPAKWLPMPAHELALALERDPELGAKLEQESAEEAAKREAGEANEAEAVRKVRAAALAAEEEVARQKQVAVERKRAHR